MTDPNSLPKAAGDAAAAKTAAENGLGASEKLAAKPDGEAGLEKAGVAKANGDKASEKAKKPSASHPQIDSMRETVESIAVAFILAFLFRTFVAEAFVIPTGSMATTLMGRHKDVQCPNCKYQFQTSASSEADKDGNVRPDVHVEKVICPNCGMPVDTSNEAKYPSYRGDRIIVSKVDSRGPRRWDVIVFRYPQEAGTNYIKRLVGLPGEVLRILGGDLFARPLTPEETKLLEVLREKQEELRVLRNDNTKESGLRRDVDEIEEKLKKVAKDKESEFRILRKPPDVVLAMLRDVYDNDHVADWMTEAGWPPRWQPCPQDIQSLVQGGWNEHNQTAWPWPAEAKVAGGWTTEDGDRSFTTDGSAKEAWLRYQHYLPGDDDWKKQLIGHAPTKVVEAYHPDEWDPKRRQDFRQSIESANKAELPAIRPRLWPIGDFTGYNYGESRNGPQDYGVGMHQWVGDLAVSCEVAQTAGSQGEVVLELIKAGHRFHCLLNLADRSVRLSIDDGAVRFDDEKGAATANAVAAKDPLPKSKSFNVLFANVDRQLHVWIDQSLVKFDGPTTYDFSPDAQTTADLSPVGIASRGASVTVKHLRIFRDVYYLTHPGAERYTLEKKAKNPEADQFFVLGDNSAASADARSWSQPYVERKLLIGKAMFIFWPHSWDSPVPFTPNWKRMEFIR